MVKPYKENIRVNLHNDLIYILKLEVNFIFGSISYFMS